MWLVCRYAHVAPFSLRPALATSSGGKTLLIPTMYAYKMALVDAAFQTDESPTRLFEILKGRVVRFEPPAMATVTQTFVRVLKPRRTDAKAGAPAEEAQPVADDSDDSADATVGFFSSTIAYREFVLFKGDLRVAIHLHGAPAGFAEVLARVATTVHTLGKRGSFVQAMGTTLEEDLPPTFTSTVDSPGACSGDAVIQALDDFGPQATLATVSPYDSAKARLGRDRIIVPAIVPYRLARAAPGFLHYVRSEVVSA